MISKDISHSLLTMASSHGTHISTQTHQLRRATSLPSLTLVYQSPISTSSNLTQSATPQVPSQLQGASRPYSTAELADRARQSLGDEIRSFKTWVQISEDALREAKNFCEQGDLNLAFVKYAIAATIVLEKLPAHPDYMVLLNSRQRRNISLVSYYTRLVPELRFGYSYFQNLGPLTLVSSFKV
jgi:hypothetical protein